MDMFEELAANITGIKLKRLHPKAMMPTIATLNSAGADLHAVEDVDLQPGKPTLVGTGWAIELPLPHMYVQIVPRSGLALKHGVTVLNSPGTVDSDYRGPMGVILINHGTEVFSIKAGDRIAQMIVSTSLTTRIPYIETTDLTDTERGEGGFGSTGKQ